MTHHLQHSQPVYHLLLSSFASFSSILRRPNVPRLVFLTLNLTRPLPSRSQKQSLCSLRAKVCESLRVVRLHTKEGSKIARPENVQYPNYMGGRRFESHLRWKFYIPRFLHMMAGFGDLLKASYSGQLQGQEQAFLYSRNLDQIARKSYIQLLNLQVARFLVSQKIYGSGPSPLAIKKTWQAQGTCISRFQILNPQMPIYLHRYLEAYKSRFQILNSQILSYLEYDILDI